ncbi:MAG: DNA polymerase III subunit gamma/tau [Patescibacteria group bacterium]|jgi:DNA polymerase-3 subunit gamma/tau
MSTLYRDYRPQNFSEVLGQNHIKITLQNEIGAGRPASAYLFCGPRAVGKTTLARVLAKAVNCVERPNGKFEPCNACASCLSITVGKNLDVVEIDAASNTGVDNVRDNIIAFSRVAPISAKFKVFIIDEVHMLSLSAFNALLKIIEEPPSYVIFILCTTEIQKVPGTVISRCERYDFKRISVKEIVKKLAYIAGQEKINIDSDVLEAVARRSGGHLRDAESLLGQIFSLGDKQITREQAELVIPHYNSNEAISLIDYLSRKDAAKAIALINNLMDSGVNVKIFITEIIELLRKIMLSKLSPELVDNLGLDLGESLEKRLASVAVNLNWEQILTFTRRFLETVNDYKNPLIPQLPLELAVAELCFGSARSGSSGSSPADFNSSPPKPYIQTKKEGSVTPPAVRSSDLKKSDLNLGTAEISSKWPEFLVKIKKHNHSLSFVLQNCEPREIKNGNLFLVFKYKFHQDRINDVNIKKYCRRDFSGSFWR